MPSPIEFMLIVGGTSPEICNATLPGMQSSVQIRNYTAITQSLLRRISLSQFFCARHDRK
jgi:hypothetical protein